MVNDADLAFASATELLARLHSRELAARDVVELYLERITRLDGKLGSYVEVTAERARAAATEADQRAAAGTTLPALHGLPVAIKDLNLWAGVRTTLGTRSLAGWIAPTDDTIVAKLLAAGAIGLGKTNVPELGTIGHTDTELHGPCATPWDLERNAGGSSGGAGAALAAGLCPLAQGSDGGGSIRIPAAVNGLVGLKPARDRVSSGPLFGELSFGLSTGGTLTRTVADAALSLDVVAGYATGDPGMAPPPSRSFQEEMRAPVGRLRIGVDRQAPFTPEGLHPSVTAALDRTVEVLVELGHEVEEVTLPVDPTISDQLRTLWAANVASQPVDATMFEPVNAWLAEIGQQRSAADAAAAQFAIQLTARGVVAAMDHLDAVVQPVVTGPSRPNGHYAGWEGEAVFADQTAWVGLTPLANLTGQPAISLPMHHDVEHGPVGVQFLGRPWDEAGLLRLAAQLETAVPWRRVPAGVT
ncbi:MAG: amidase [Nitriliruptoraceae bacterium]